MVNIVNGALQGTFSRLEYRLTSDKLEREIIEESEKVDNTNKVVYLLYHTR